MPVFNQQKSISKNDFVTPLFGIYFDNKLQNPDNLTVAQNTFIEALTNMDQQDKNTALLIKMNIVKRLQSQIQRQDAKFMVQILNALYPDDPDSKKIIRQIVTLFPRIFLEIDQRYRKDKETLIAAFFSNSSEDYIQKEIGKLFLEELSNGNIKDGHLYRYIRGIVFSYHPGWQPMMNVDTWGGCAVVGLMALTIAAVIAIQVLFFPHALVVTIVPMVMICLITGSLTGLVSFLPYAFAIGKINDRWAKSRINDYTENPISKNDDRFFKEMSDRANKTICTDKPLGDRVKEVLNARDLTDKPLGDRVKVVLNAEDVTHELAPPGYKPK